MKTRVSLFIPGLGVLITLVGLACNVGVVHPYPPTVQPPVQPTLQLTAQPAPAQTNNNTNGAGSTVNNGNTNSGNGSAENGVPPITFIDQNKFYQINVPGGWKYTSNNAKYFYSDRFTAPDGNALVENYTYNDGTPFTGAQISQFALKLLNQLYGTGQIGDVRFSHDQLMPDGTERLSWTSKGRGCSGLSYFKVQGGVNFLMFTVEWINDHQSTYLDVLNKIRASYKVP